MPGQEERAGRSGGTATRSALEGPRASENIDALRASEEVDALRASEEVDALRASEEVDAQRASDDVEARRASEDADAQLASGRAAPSGDPTDELRAVRSRGVVLRADEVSRHRVRLVAIGRDTDSLAIRRFAALPELLRAGDLVVVNDAATVPGSLHGTTARGDVIELRLSGPIDGSRLAGVLFGAGDHRTRTEDRPPPPSVSAGDTLWIAGLALDVVASAGRRVELLARASVDELWQAVYAHGAPVQYAHRPAALPLYEVQTAYAARPWAAEMPSAGRPLTWDVLLGLKRAGIAIVTLTHAAGLSSTGDDALDRALPWPERYEIPRATIEAIAAAKARGGRVIAVGTTVVRALESAAQAGPLVAGGGVATLRLGPGHALRVVDGLVSGLHVPGESHFELLTAFAPRERLTRALELAAREGLSSHELGDSCLIAPLG